MKNLYVLASLTNPIIYVMENGNKIDALANIELKELAGVLKEMQKKHGITDYTIQGSSYLIKQFKEYLAKKGQ